jgi:hypothetical protein
LDRTLCWQKRGEVRAVSVKGGLMMGTIKVGAFSSPRKKAFVMISEPKQKVKKNFL